MIQSWFWAGPSFRKKKKKKKEHVDWPGVFVSLLGDRKLAVLTLVMSGTIKPTFGSRWENEDQKEWLVWGLTMVTVITFMEIARWVGFPAWYRANSFGLGKEGCGEKGTTGPEVRALTGTGFFRGRMAYPRLPWGRSADLFQKKQRMSRKEIPKPCT